MDRENMVYPNRLEYSFEQEAFKIASSIRRKHAKELVF